MPKRSIKNYASGKYPYIFSQTFDRWPTLTNSFGIPRSGRRSGFCFFISHHVCGDEPLAHRLWCISGLALQLSAYVLLTKIASSVKKSECTQLRISFFFLFVFEALLSTLTKIFEDSQIANKNVKVFRRQCTHACNIWFLIFNAHKVKRCGSCCCPVTAAIATIQSHYIRKSTMHGICERIPCLFFFPILFSATNQITYTQDGFSKWMIIWPKELKNRRMCTINILCIPNTKTIRQELGYSIYSNK